MPNPTLQVILEAVFIANYLTDIYKNSNNEWHKNNTPLNTTEQRKQLCT